MAHYLILSLSDAFCVERHRESFLKLIGSYIDILFCNEEELKSLLKQKNLEKCQEYISTLCELNVITTGSKGSLIINGDQTIKIKPKVLGEVIDTTGAGDIYAGGFIHGLINNYPLNRCGNIGSICAGHIVTKIGSRSDTNLKELIKQILRNY